MADGTPTSTGAKFFERSTKRKAACVLAAAAEAAAKAARANKKEVGEGDMKKKN